MKRLHSVVGALVACGLMAAAPMAWAQPDAAIEKRAAAEPESSKAPRPQYIRVQDSEDGGSIRLQLAVREFKKADGKGPVVSMAGAVHIGDRGFYETLQKELDSKDVVLFEGVKPPGVGRAEHGLKDATDQTRIDATKKRQRLLASLVVAYRGKHGELPASLDLLSEQGDKRIGWIVSTARQDGWGRELVYLVRAPAAPAEGEKPAKATFDLVSLGADGKEGGEGAAADLKFSDQKPLTKDETAAVGGGGNKEEGGEGIQEQLARALGLVFQLNHMDHTKPNWRNSDMSVDQVQERLDKAGADSGTLFKMLDGSSLEARFAGMLFRLIGSNKTWSAMGKMMMVQLLARADEMMVAMPGGMGAMMDVIIKDRNEVVIEDLKQVIEKEPNVKTVGIIYGAGHLADMEKRLAALGYERTGEKWLTAINADIAATGMSAKEVRQMRRMFDQMMDDQLKAAQRQKDKKKTRKTDE